MHAKPTVAPLDAGSFETMRFRTLDEWLAWQEELHFSAIDLGLDRCTEVAERMGLLHPEYTVISVAGTNGKGSSACLLNAIYLNAGYSVGTYTSPHLIRYNERIRINGAEVSDRELCGAFERIDRARGDISLTYFEFGTLAAMDIFHRYGVEIAILEVGLGGRLDAVNCLDADVALITSIALDHENWLGNDRESIGREKAGILRSGAPAITSDTEPPASILEYAGSIGAPMYISGKDFNLEITDSSWSWRYDTIEYSDLPFPSQHNSSQVGNASGVLMAVTAMRERFPVGEESIREALRSFNLLGRFQIVPDKAQLVLDVAHNREAAALLVENLKSLPVKGKTHVLIGMLKDKNHASIFGELAAIADEWHIVTLENPRGADCHFLAEVLKGLSGEETIRCHDDVASALTMIRGFVDPGDRIVITGSFLTVGAAINLLNLQH